MARSIPKPPSGDNRGPQRTRRHVRTEEERKAMRHYLRQAAAGELGGNWYQQQQASPSRYPETWWQTAENAGARRQFDTGQRQATYTPPTQAQAVAGPLRSFAEQQRQAPPERSIREAFAERSTALPPLSGSIDRDEILREMYKLWLTGRGNR